MKTQNEIVTELVCQYLDIEGIAGPEEQYEKVLDRLRPQIQCLLDTDMQTLLNALYRIDVDEQKFRYALEIGDPEEISLNISKLILDRIILKAQTRLKYSQ